LGNSFLTVLERKTKRAIGGKRQGWRERKGRCERELDRERELICISMGDR
jgi:hypothetical protein